MAWTDLKKVKTMPLGMALGTVSKMITGQDLNIKPRQLQKLKDKKLEDFYTHQEHEREKLFMVFANHFTAPEDVEKAREDFWGFINYLYGTHTLRSYINVVLSHPAIIEGLIEIYFKSETQLQELTYALDRRAKHVKSFGRAIETMPAQLTTLIENYDGNSAKFIDDMSALEPEARPAPQDAQAAQDINEDTENRDQKENASPDAENSAAEANVNNEDMKEAV
jgi:pyruvate/2-oxoglutarate dehydrogenase complex dihydrolipoamide acyltransferase (E2) component